MKQAKFYIIISGLAIILLTLTRVVVTNTISTNGIDLANIQDKTNELKKQNALIREEILESSSLFHIASEAAEVGFVPSKTQMVLSSPAPLALK